MNRRYSPTNRSDRMVQFRLTESEYQTLRSVAQAEQRTMSEAVRIRVFGIPVPPVARMQDSGPVEVR